MRNLGVHLFIVANLACLMLAGCAEGFDLSESPQACVPEPVPSPAPALAKDAEPPVHVDGAGEAKASDVEAISKLCLVVPAALANEYWSERGFQPQPNDVVILSRPRRTKPVLVLHKGRILHLPNPSRVRMTDVLPWTYEGPQTEGNPILGPYEVEILNGEHRGKKGLVTPDQIKVLAQR
jgi:hypothetical protein